MQHEQVLNTIDSFDFDAHEVSEAVGRKNSFVFLVYQMMANLGNFTTPTVALNFDKLVPFLQAICAGYDSQVAYHNDLHGADVAQMLYLMVSKGGLNSMAQLNYLDLVAMITAGACHDFAHDGFTNVYHVNFMTDRAIRYHDKAVQENWHASESMKLLLMPENNFMEAFGESEMKLLRKRMIGMILATDMADHMSHVNVMDFQIKDKQITREAGNGGDLIDTTGQKELFESQQQCLDLMIHACDLSTPTRRFDTLKRWTYLLFEEFFA